MLVPATMTHSEIDKIAALRFLRYLYTTPEHRVRAQDAERTAADLGVNSSIVATLRNSSPALVQEEGEWLVLTTAGEEWYRENFAALMSRSE